MVSLNRNLTYQLSRKEQLDSMMNFLEAQTIKGNESEFYYLGRVLIRTRCFQPNDSTITQLKNSGALGLIRNDQAADSINHKPAGNPPLRSYYASLHKDLAYRIHQLKGSNRILDTRLTQLSEKAAGIISFLQKAYHPE